MNTHAEKPCATLHVHFVLYHYVLDYFRVSSVIYNEKTYKVPISSDGILVSKYISHAVRFWRRRREIRGAVAVACNTDKSTYIIIIIIKYWAPMPCAKVHAWITADNFL